MTSKSKTTKKKPAPPPPKPTPSAPVTHEVTHEVTHDVAPPSSASPPSSTAPILGFASNVVAHGDGAVNRFALVVGVSKYDDPKVEALPYCVRDAQRIGESLAARGFKVTLMHDGLTGDGAPTVANVRRAIADLIKHADEDDLLLVHFSCHGKLLSATSEDSPRRPYLMLADTPNDDDALASRGLALADVLKALRGQPRWVAIFLDACHMGLGLDPETIASTEHSQAKQGGFALLAGSTEGQVTQDSDAQSSGIFTAALLEGLGGAAARPDGAVLFSPLAQYVQRAVAAWRQTSEAANKDAHQTPVLRLEVADLTVFPAVGYIDLKSKLDAKITCAEFSGDGRWLATASEDCAVRLWTPSDGKPAMSPMHPLDAKNQFGYVGGVAFSPNALAIASASNNGTARIWQVAGANLVTPELGDVNAMLTKVRYAIADPTRLAVSSSAGTVIVFDTDPIGRPARARTIEAHEGAAWDLAWTRDGRIVSVGNDKTACVINVDKGEVERRLTFEGPLWAVAVDHDRGRVATAGTDVPASSKPVNVPRIWDLATGKEIVRLVGHAGGVTSLAFARKGELLASTSYDRTTRLWSTKDGREMARFSIDHPTEAYAACFSPDGAWLFTGYADGRGRIFDVSSYTR